MKLTADSLWRVRDYLMGEGGPRLPQELQDGCLGCGSLARDGEV